MRFNISVQRLDSLIGRLRQCFETFPDKRRGMNITYSMADIAMAAFSAFCMQSPSFLAYQRHLQEGHGRSNCEKPVRDKQNPERQPHPRYAGPRRPGAVVSDVCRSAGGNGAI